MHSNQAPKHTQEDTESGFPIQGIVALTVIVLGVAALVLKAMGVF